MKQSAHESFTRDGKRVLGLGVAAAFTTLLSQVVFTFAIPSLTTSLAASSSQVQWILAGFSLTFGIALVPSGRLGDRTGRRILFIIGMAIFTAACLLGAFAPSASVVIIARLLQGAGAGMLNPQVLGFFQDFFHGGARAKAFGRYMTAGSIAGLIGPIAMGLVLLNTPEEIGWRLAFLISVPFGVTAVIFALIYLPKTLHTPKATPFDIQGVLLLSLATLFALGGIIQWHDGTLERYAALGLAVVSVIGFIFWERYASRQNRYPLLDERLLKSPGYLLGTAVATLNFGSALGLGAITTLYLIQNVGFSAFEVALILIPDSIGAAIGSYFSWKLIGKYGRVGISVVMLINLILTVIEIAFLSMGNPLSIIILFVTLGAVQGATAGLFVPTNQTMTLNNSPDDIAGVAVSFLQLTQRYAAAIAIAVSTSIYFGTSKTGNESESFINAGIFICAMMLLALVAGTVDAFRQKRHET